MRNRALIAAIAALILTLAVAGPARAVADVRVTGDDTPGSYLRYDGGSDASTAGCSTGRRPQNEPTVAIDPSNTAIVVAGSNDYCRQTVGGDVWAGYHRSTDGGLTWRHSLVPGYPGDESAAGQASPLSGQCAAAGDPTQAFDADGRLFYAFICFNRTKPVNGSVYVARYLGHGASYDRTVLVKKGTPSGLFLTGLFQDKINLTADQTSGPGSGNVYVAWSQYDGFAPTNAVLFSRSTDHGLSFSRPVRVTPVELGTASFADLAVGPDGAVYLTYLTYPSSARPTWDILHRGDPRRPGEGLRPQLPGRDQLARSAGHHRRGARRPPVVPRHRRGRRRPDGGLQRLQGRSGLLAGPAARQHRRRGELRRCGQRRRRPVLRRRPELDRDPGLQPRQQLRLGNPRRPAGRVLG
jgi:hypothetical protein